MKKEEDILVVFDIARKEYKGLHILINNAGLGHSVPLLEGTTEQFRDMTEVNVIGMYNELEIKTDCKILRD